MKARRQVLVAVTVWLAVVALGSTLVWAVIARAGEGVLTAADPAPTADGVTASEPGVLLRRKPSPASPSDQASADDPGTAASTPATTSEAPSPTGPTGPTGSTGSASPDQGGSGDPGAQRRTWQGRAGVVVAECRGSAIRLVAAQPNSGWSVEVKDSGPEELEVRFREGGDEGEGEVEVHARCVDGSPSFTSGDDG